MDKNLRCQKFLDECVQQCPCIVTTLDKTGKRTWKLPKCGPGYISKRLHPLRFARCYAAATDKTETIVFYDDVVEIRCENGRVWKKGFEVINGGT